MKINAYYKWPTLLVLAVVLVLIRSQPRALAASVTGDINGDGTVTSADLTAFLPMYGTTSSTGDLNGNGTVDIYDLSILLSKLAAGNTGGSQTPPATAEKLTWAPPISSAPTTINVPTGDTAYTATLNNSTDYILKLPAESRGPVTIKGGHNVVMIGGHLHMDANNVSAGRILYIMGNGGTTGTVHVEGILLDRDEGLEADDIAVNAPGKTVQIENVRGMGVRGSYDTTGGYAGVHGDVVQPWGGVENLRIDHLTASSNYQGLFLRPDLGHLGTLDLRNIDLAYDSYPPVGGGYLIWLTTDGGGTYGETADSIIFNNVYISQVRAASTFAHSIWPQVGATKGAVITNNVATWPSLPAVSGGVTYGTPTGGQFVPDGVAGTDYVSPGYK